MGIETFVKKNFLLLLIGGVILYAGGFIPGFAPQTVMTTAGGQTTVDGITINTGTPTLEWSAVDIITGQTVNPGHFRVSVDGSESDLLSTDTVNASIGDAYEVCLMPNTTYYAACKSGTVSKTVEKVVIETYALGSATIWVNNDPENATTRNTAAAPDTLATLDTDTPTVCVQGATANASYGDGKILFIFDYNSSQLDEEPIFSVGTKRNDLIPSTYTTDSNVGTAKVAYEVEIALTNQETVCGSLTVEASTKTTDFIWSDVTIDVYDHFTFRNTTSDALEEGYAIVSNGDDTNSATNATTDTWHTV